jgi:hypothetical protein
MHLLEEPMVIAVVNMISYERTGSGASNAFQDTVIGHQQSRDHCGPDPWSSSR